MQHAAQTQEPWTPQQQAWFTARYISFYKDEAIGVLLAFFLGGFGAHRFYLRQYGIGVLYLIFFWTGVPALIALIECFFMPGRVRFYNWELSLQMHALTPTHPTAPAAVGWQAPVLALPAPALFCRNCGASLSPSARFCERCATAV